MGRATATSSTRVPSTIGNWLHAILRALDARGIDSREVAREAGVSERALSGPNERVPQPVMTALWRKAVEATGDPSFPMSVPRAATTTTFGALTLASLASPDLGSAFRRIARFHRLVSDAVNITFVLRDDVGEFFIDIVSPSGPPAEAIDAFFVLVARFARGLTAGRRTVEPQRVHLQRPTPIDTEVYRHVFRAPVEFGEPRNTLVYSRSDCEMRLPDGNLELALLNDRVVAEMLDRPGDTSLTDKVRTLLVENLSESPSETFIARQLAMSRSSLHAALRREGATYRDVLNRTREDLACSYLRAGRYSVKEIAFLLGFADASTFTRAFRRWTGTTPQRYANGQ